MRSQPRFSILVIDRDPELCAALGLAIRTEFGASALECCDPITAQAFIDDCAELDLCILLDVDQAAELAARAMRLHPGLPMILASEIAGNDPITEIIRLLRTKVFTGEPETKLKEDEFFEVSTRLLLKTSPLPTDIYLRMSENKFLKVMSRGDTYDLADHDRFVHQKKVNSLFVTRKDSAQLVGMLDASFRNLKKGNPPDLEALRRVTEDLHASVHDLISHVGVTEEVRELTHETVTLALHAISGASKGKGGKDIQNLLDRFTLESDKYIPQHSLLLAELCCLLAGRLGWVSASTFQKLVFASLYHDLSLKNDDLARTSTLASLNLSQSNVLLDSVEEINSHPHRSAALLRQLKDVPPDVEQIILHHHEKPDGNGFPAGIKQGSFTPLSALFVVAHDFVDYFLELSPADRATSLPRFLDDVEERYTQGNFKQIWRELKAKAT